MDKKGKTSKYYNPYKMFVGSFVPNWLMERKELSPGSKLCFARLCQYAGKNGDCFPSINSLAKEIGSSPRMTRRYIKELSTINTIETKRNSKRENNRYYFLRHEWLMSYKESGHLDRTDMTPQKHLDRTDMTPREGTDMTPLLHKENHRRESYKRKYIKEKLFDKFYSSYPLKKSKGQAKKTFMKLIEKMDSQAANDFTDNIINSLNLQATERTIRKNMGHWLPQLQHPSTWLNAEGWENDICINEEEIENDQSTTKTGIDFATDGTL